MSNPTLGDPTPVKGELERRDRVLYVTLNTDNAAAVSAWSESAIEEGREDRTEHINEYKHKNLDIIGGKTEEHNS